MILIKITSNCLPFETRQANKAGINPANFILLQTLKILLSRLTI